MPNRLTLPAGVRRAVHVYTKALLERMQVDAGQQLWLVRSSRQNYERAMVVRRLRILGPCEGDDLFGRPLPGTGGRGVAILFTEAAIEVEFDGTEPTYLEMTEAGGPYIQTKGVAPSKDAPVAASRSARR